MNTQDKALNEAAEKYFKETYPIYIGKPFPQADYYAGAISDAAEQYWKEKFQLNKQVGAVWIAASKRLPDKFKPVIVRNVHNGKVATMANMTHDTGWNAGFDEWRYSETEWLDEQFTPTISFSEDEMDGIKEAVDKYHIAKKKEFNKKFPNGLAAALQQNSVDNKK